MLAYITWSTDPYLVVGDLQIRWYSICFAIACMFFGWFLTYFAKQEDAPEEEVNMAILVNFFCGVLGARLLHVFYYDWPYFSQHTGEILQVWNGGLASHGGVIGFILGTYIYSRYFGTVYYWWWFDRVSLAVPLSAAFIRLGNFFNSELYGQATDVPWAVIYTLVDELPRHPVQLYESIWYFICFLIVLPIYLKKKGTLAFGYYTAITIALINSGRFVIEFWKEGETYLGLINSQYLDLLYVALALLLLAAVYFRKVKL